VLYIFRALTNSSPLVLDGADNLYGTASDAGGKGSSGNATYGEVYKLTPGGKYGRWRFVSLYKFSGKQDGGFPQGGVIFDGKGNLYGTASMGGTNGYGVVFELTP
jgi:uncharacterized repeat protein (TIGR03803 family)